jgi:4-hydroxyphenylacetate 3-monooxygenase
MIRTGQQYRDSIRDDRQVWVNGDRVKDATVHVMFRPLVDVRARIYDMQHDPRFAHALSYCSEADEVCAVALKLPHTQADWRAKREAVEAVLNEIGGVVTRVGDETVGEMWSLFDGQGHSGRGRSRLFGKHPPARRSRCAVGPVSRLGQYRPQGRPIEAAAGAGSRHAFACRQGDGCRHCRARAKFETAAAYANQAFTKPTIANWGDAELSDYAVGFICDLGSPNLKFICRTGFAGRAPVEDYPLANRFDEIDTLVILDDVLIPWENVLFYRHTKAASFIRATLHRYSAYAFVLRSLKVADMMIGAALFNARQTGLDKQQAVQEKLALLAGYREGINAHLTAAVAMVEESPGGLLMPNQSLLYTGRVLASSQLNPMMHICRELCGGQICLTPDFAAFQDPETAGWLDKYYSINAGWQAEDRRRLLAFARDLLNSDYAGHRLTFQLFAQSPPYANLAAVYRNFDWDAPLRFVHKSAGLSDRVLNAIEPARPGATGM